MAYLKKLDTPCDGNCGRRAVVALYNRFNDLVARYCQRCGEKALRFLQERQG